MVAVLFLVAALLSIPYLNDNVFHIKNLSEVRREAKSRFREIQDLQSIGQTRLARDSIRAMVEFFSKNDDDVSKTITQLGMFQLASNYKQFAVSAEDYNDAIYEFEKLLKKYPETSVAEQTFLMIAKSHIALAGLGKDARKNYERAIQSLEKIEQNRFEALNFPKYKQRDLKPGKYFNIDRGKVKGVNRNLSKKLYTKADALRELASDTTQVKAELLSDAVVLIGDCYAKMGEGDKAREQYKLIIDFFQESDLVDDAWKSTGDAYVQEADILLQPSRREGGEAGVEVEAKARALYEKGAEMYLKFINVFSQSDLVSKVYIALGIVYFKLHRESEAYATFQRAINSIKVIEEQAKIQLDIGNYYYGEKKWKEAIDNYAKVLQNYSNTEYASNAQYLLAESYEGKGDTTEALKTYNDLCDNYKASTFYPLSAFKIAKMHIHQKNYPKAQEYLRQITTRFQESVVAPQSQYQLGLIFMDLAESVDSTEAKIKYRSAIEEFQRVLDNYGQAESWVEKSLLAIGRCYMKQGLKDKARQTLGSLQSQASMVEKLRILGVEGTDSAIVKDYADQYGKLTDDQAKAQMLIEIGRKLKAEGINRPDSAASVFREATRLAQDTITLMTAFGELADALVKTGEHKKAREIFQDEILNNPRCEETRRIQTEFRVAETFYRERAHAEAVKRFSEFIAQYPTHALVPPGLYLMARAQLDGSEPAKARETFRRIKALPAGSDYLDDAVLGDAEALVALKESAAAADSLKKFLAVNPGVSTAPNFYFKLGEIYRENLQDSSAAVENYEKVTKFPDTHLLSAAAYQMGMLHSSRGEDEKAVAALEKVKKEDAQYFRAAQGEIGAIKAKTDPEGAILNYEKIEASSDDVESKTIARMGIGDIQVAQKQYVKAVESFRVITDQLKGTDPDLRAASLVKIVDALNSAGKFEDLLTWANRMIQEFPDHRYTVNAYYLKANAYSSLKKYKEAREVFLQLMQRDTTSLGQVAQYQRAECLLSMQNTKGAVEEFKQFMSRHPKSDLVANALFHMGNLDWGEQKYAEAKRVYLRILSEYPNFQANCWVKNYLAFCYDKEGTWRKAKEIYDQVRSTGCDAESKDFAKKQIQSINVKH